jgi:hypothetical protein
LKSHLKCLLTGPKKVDQTQCSGAGIEAALIGPALLGSGSLAIVLASALVLWGLCAWRPAAA